MPGITRIWLFRGNNYCRTVLCIFMQDDSDAQSFVTWLEIVGSSRLRFSLKHQVQWQADEAVGLECPKSSTQRTMKKLASLKAEILENKLSVQNI